MKAGASAYVDLDMKPRRAFELTTQKAQLTYDNPDETSESIQMFNEGQIIVFKSARSHLVQNINYVEILAGVVVLGILPLVYSARLKMKREKLYKSS